MLCTSWCNYWYLLSDDSPLPGLILLRSVNRNDWSNASIYTIICKVNTLTVIQLHHYLHWGGCFHSSLLLSCLVWRVRFMKAILIEPVFEECRIAFVKIPFLRNIRRKPWSNHLTFMSRQTYSLYMGKVFFLPLIPQVSKSLLQASKWCNKRYMRRRRRVARA